MKLWREHQLSLVVGGIWLLMLSIGAILPTDNFGQWFSNHAAEVFGALVVVVTQKILHLREIGRRDQTDGPNCKS